MSVTVVVAVVVTMAMVPAAVVVAGTAVVVSACVCLAELVNTRAHLQVHNIDGIRDK